MAGKLLAVSLMFIKMSSVISILACRPDPVDIIFVLDESGSVGRTNFGLQLDFIADFVDGFTIGQHAAQIALLTFSTMPVVEFHLNTYLDKDNLKEQIRKVSYSHPGLTRTAAALEYVRVHCLKSENGYRRNASHIIIVMTDGISLHTDRTINESRILKSMGFSMFAIGISNSTDANEINKIASDINKSVIVSDFTDLGSIRDQIVTSTCKDITKVTQTTSTFPTKRSQTTNLSTKITNAATVQTMKTISTTLPTMNTNGSPSPKPVYSVSNNGHSNSQASASTILHGNLANQNGRTVSPVTTKPNVATNPGRFESTTQVTRNFLHINANGGSGHFINHITNNNSNIPQNNSSMVNNNAVTISQTTTKPNTHSTVNLVNSANLNSGSAGASSPNTRPNFMVNIFPTKISTTNSYLNVLPNTNVNNISKNGSGMTNLSSVFSSKNTSASTDIAGSGSAGHVPSVYNAKPGSGPAVPVNSSLNSNNAVHNNVVQGHASLTAIPSVYVNRPGQTNAKPASASVVSGNYPAVNKWGTRTVTGSASAITTPINSKNLITKSLTPPRGLPNIHQRPGSMVYHGVSSANNIGATRPTRPTKKYFWNSDSLNNGKTPPYGANVGTISNAGKSGNGANQIPVGSGQSHNASNPASVISGVNHQTGTENVGKNITSRVLPGNRSKDYSYKRTASFPLWFEYLEIGVVSVVSLVALGFLGFCINVLGLMLCRKNKRSIAVEGKFGRSLPTLRQKKTLV